MRLSRTVLYGFFASVLLAGALVTSCENGSTEQKDSDKEITAFAIATPAVGGIIDEAEHTIKIVLPYGTALTALTPSITHTGDKIYPASGTAQDFTNPVAYTVTAEDDSTQAYTVTASTAPLDVGVIMPSGNDNRWMKDISATKAALEGKASFASARITDDANAQQNELKCAQDFISLGMKVLIIAPMNGSDCPAAKAAKEAGVKVISYDRGLAGTKNIDYYLSFDNFDVGKKMGQYLVDKASLESATGLDLYLYSGIHDDPNASIFFRGSWSVLQPKINSGKFTIRNSAVADGLKANATLTDANITAIFAQIDTRWNIPTATDPNPVDTLANDNLAAYAPSATGNVYMLAPNDDTARHISKIFCDATKAHYITRDRLISTGQDCELQTVQDLIDGKQSMTILKDVRRLGKQAAAMALDILAGNTPTTTSTWNNGTKEVPSYLLDTQIVEKSSIQRLLIDSGYYSASDFTGL